MLSSRTQPTIQPARKLSMLMQNSPLAMVEWSCDLIVTGWNAAAVELFNFFEDEAIGARIDRLLSERQIADLGLDSWQSCEKSGVLREHGHTVWVQGASRPERLPDNSIVWDGLLINISHTKQAEADLLRSEVELRTQANQLKTALYRLKQTQAKLIQSEKMSSLGQLVAGIAREINNPVNFIHGNLSYLQSYIEDLMKASRCYQAHYPVPIQSIQDLSADLELDYIAQDLPKLMGSVQLGTERIQQIVLSLRNFSRLDESKLKLADIHEGLESALMILSSRLAAMKSRKAIEIIKAYENIPMVECYVSQLNQVFMNILMNAVDAIDGASVADKSYQIVLQTFQTADSVVVQITNNGPPISKADRKRMFDPFFTTKPVGKGTGMGLAISYQTIVDLHKGSLDCAQTEEGKTVFAIGIPKVAATASLNVCNRLRES